jgi:hypothetical protein
MPQANGHTQLGTVYHRPLLSKEGDIAWTILHSELSHHNSYTNEVNQILYCPWCPGAKGTIDHMFFDCPTVTAFWNRLAKIFHYLLGPYPLLKKLVLCGYSTLYIASVT